jgi:hypothetical protein
MSPYKRTSRALPAALYETQRPSPSLLYEEKASAARNGFQERRGRRYRRPSVARYQGGSKRMQQLPLVGVLGANIACVLRIAVGMIRAVGF